ncbi:MAG: hypothetical protein ACUVYA_03930 [Planctomycetota bacterium]
MDEERRGGLRRARGGAGGSLAIAALAIAGAAAASAESAPPAEGPSGVFPGKVWAKVGPERAEIGNEHLALSIAFEGGRFRTVLLRNLRARKDVRLEGEDFAVELEGGRVLRPGELPVSSAREEGEPAARRLRVECAHPDFALALVTELRRGEAWLSRWLEISRRADAPPDPAAPGSRRAPRLRRVSLADWRAEGVAGPVGPGATVETLGAPSGCGQVVYAGDAFFAIAHPAAENFALGGRISASIPAYAEVPLGAVVRTPRLIAGCGERGGARRSFYEYLDRARATPARMLFLVNDWYWKEKDKPVEALRELARVKGETGVPIDSFTLDDGWDFAWDEASGIWGRLNRRRFPGGWESLVEAGRPAGIGISLWFGPIGGYGRRAERVEFGRSLGFETRGDRLCLAGSRYRRHVIESFSRWAERGMDYIKVDGFWPDCPREDHGHPAGPAGAVAQMDALMEVFRAWRRARPDLRIGYTSGSSPSPFWLEAADFVWRGGADDAHAGAGDPFDRQNTYIDSCLEAHRSTEMPISAFVTFDMVPGRIAGSSARVFERGVWWLAARTSLHHDWYVQAGDLTLEEWRALAKAARWAKEREGLFRFSRMVGGDVRRGEVYGFSAFDAGRGTLALRNPSAEARSLESTLADLSEMPEADRARSYRVRAVYGAAAALEGARRADEPLYLELPPLEIAVVDVEAE